MQRLLLVYNSFLVMLIDHNSPLTAVLLNRPNKQLIRRFLNTLPKGLSVLEHPNILQILRPITTIPMRISIFELPSIHKLRREQQALTFSPRQGRDIIANGAIIDDIIGVDNKRVLGVDVMIVDRGSDDDGSTGHAAVFDVEEAIADGSVPADIAVEVKIVLGGFVPVEVLLLAAVYNIELGFCMAGGVLILSKSSRCWGWIWIEAEMGLKVDIMGQNSPTSLFQMQLLQIVTPIRGFKYDIKGRRRWIGWGGSGLGRVMWKWISLSYHENAVGCMSQRQQIGSLAL